MIVILRMVRISSMVSSLRAEELVGAAPPSDSATGPAACWATARLSRPDQPGIPRASYCLHQLVRRRYLGVHLDQVDDTLEGVLCADRPVDDQRLVPYALDLSGMVRRSCRLKLFISSTKQIRGMSYLSGLS